jgi:hypothetical protein
VRQTVRQNFMAAPVRSTSGRRGWAVVVASICALVVSGALGGQASAVTRVLTAKVGPDGTDASLFTGPTSTAFNRTGNTIYLHDSGPGLSKIYGFDVSAPGTFAPLTGNFPLNVAIAGNAGRALAVDETGLSSSGNIYYVPGSNTDLKIHGFTSAGVPLGGSFPVTVPGLTAGLAVDSTGRIWVVDRTAQSIRRYSSAGVEEGVPISVSTAPPASFPVAPSTARLAFDSNDDLFYIAATTAPVYRFTAASGYSIKTEVTTVPAGIRSIGVDPVTHNLYLPNGAAGASRIDARNSTGSPLYDFGKVLPDSTTHVYQSASVNGNRDEIYAAETPRFKQLMVFSQPGDPATATLEPVSNLTGTHATLNGTVNANGVTVTECKFEYGLTNTYGQSVPCSGSIPTDTTPHPVTATLTNLKPQGTTYHYRLVAKNTIGTSPTGDAVFVTPDTFITGSASSIAVSTTTLNGSVNPDGVALTGCKFEYGITPAYGSVASCDPAAGAIPADAGPRPVSAALTGLAGNTTYHFRISATSPLGTGAGADQTFETLGAPQLLTQTTSPVGRTGATLYTEVNPRGFSTNYHFEYGKTSTYGSQAPADIELFGGAGTLPVKGSAKLSNLEEGSTYHYRAVATSSAGTTLGPDQTFTTGTDPSDCANAVIRAAQVSVTLPSGSTELSLCMALEMASPPQKGQQPIKFPGGLQNASISADGDHVIFRSGAALAGTEAVSNIAQGDVYVASRDEDGWATTPTILRPMNGLTEPVGLAPDFSRWFQISAEDKDQNGEGISQTFESHLDRTVKPFSPLLMGMEEPRTQAKFAGASGDLSHLYVKAGDKEITLASPTRYSPDDPAPAPGDVARSNVYIALLGENGQPEPPQLFARDLLGKEWGGNCGVRVGGDVSPSASQGQVSQQVRIQGAISENGSRVYFSTRPAQPESGPCSAANKLRILKRTETPDGPVIVELVGNECDRVAPACDAAAGDDNFQGASADGTKVYFTTTRQLADSDLDSGTSCGNNLGQATGCDLYLYDSTLPAGNRLTQVSAGDATNPTPGAGAKVLNSIAGISTDGSHVYFAAEGILTTAANKLGTRAQIDKPNLYLWERGSVNPDGHIAFIGTLAPGDAGGLWGGSEAFGASSVYPVPAMGADGDDIGGDGHVLLFKSRAQLTGNDIDGSRRDVYRYDSETGSTQCISCLPGGDSAPADDTALITAGVETVGAKGNPLGPAFVSLGRWVSEDGKAVVFATGASLLSGDNNGSLDDYLWRDGQLQRLPGSDLLDAPTISSDGSAVAFRSADPLLPQDGDTVADLYVARSEGGFPIPIVAPDCAGEACQEPFHSQPTSSAVASEAPLSPGNVTEKPPKCKKGFVRRKGKCVKRHPGKKHHHQKSRAASNGPGGLK